MKIKILLLPLLCLAPVFLNAGTSPDFDGRSGGNRDLLGVLREEAADFGIKQPRAERAAPRISRRLEVQNGSGQFVEVRPVVLTDPSGTVTYQYAVQPGSLGRWTMFCPAKTTWTHKTAYTWEQDKAGHIHTSPRPPSLASRYSASGGVPASISGAASPVESPSLKGDATSYHWVRYPEFAARLVQRAEARGGCESDSGEWVDVKVPDLVDVPEGTGFVLVGTTSAHPSDNHYATPEFKEQAEAIGREWDRLCPASEKLRFNDISLIWGGIFDITGEWSPPHNEHRFGNNMDISKRYVRKGNRKKLLTLLCSRVRVHSEGDAGGEPQPHYHLTSKTSRHPEDFPDPRDVRYIDCCRSSGPPAECVNLESHGSSAPEELPVATNCP